MRTTWRTTTLKRSNHIRMVQSPLPHSIAATLPTLAQHKTRAVVEYHSRHHGPGRPLRHFPSPLGVRRSLAWPVPHPQPPRYHALHPNPSSKLLLPPPRVLPLLSLPLPSGERRVLRTRPPLRRSQKHPHPPCRDGKAPSMRRTGVQLDSILRWTEAKMPSQRGLNPSLLTVIGTT